MMSNYLTKKTYIHKSLIIIALQNINRFFGVFCGETARCGVAVSCESKIHRIKNLRFIDVRNQKTEIRISAASTATYSKIQIA